LKTTFRRGLIAATILPLILFAARGGHAEAVRPDLVLVDVSAQALLEEHEIPVMWKGASFFLARWDDDRQQAARDLGISYERLVTDFDATRQLYLFEISMGDPPSEWQDRVVYEDGRKWVLELDAAEAAEWTRRGHAAVRVSRDQTAWERGAPRVSYDCAYDPLIDGLLDRTSQAKWLDWIEKLSGAEPVTIDGEEQTILTRSSSPMFSGNPDARGYDFVLQQVQAWHYGPTRIEEHEYSGLGGTWKNLVVTLPGVQSVPDEMVLITAHLDSVNSSSGSPAPGADDNGTGSATLLEAARLLRQYRFQRTIRIIFFTGEEQGLVGSEAYVAEHDTGNHLGVVNLDMMGWDGDEDRCFEIHAGTLPASIDVADCMRDSTVVYNLGLSHDFLTTGATDRSDHASFWQASIGAIEVAENFFFDGLPGGCVGQDRNPSYHTAGDTVDQLEPSFGSSIARAGLATLAAMAIPVEACFDDAPMLWATPGVSANTLAWNTLAGAAAYRVSRSTQGCEGQWLEIGETQQTQWVDDTADEALTYSYRVEAVDADGFCVSNTSNCASATPTIHQASATDVVWIDTCASGGPGDGNGLVEPGESVVVPVTLTNTGNTALSAITGMLSIPLTGIVVVDPDGAWPDLAPGGTAQSIPDHFGFSVSSELPCGTTVEGDIDLTYTEGANQTGLPVRIGTTHAVALLDETFAAGIPADWTIVDGGTGGGVAATWTADNPGGRSIAPPFQAPFAVVDSDVAGSSATQDEGLITPYLDSTGCAELSLEFDSQFNWYSGSEDERADLDVSVDGWSWVNVLRIQGDDDGYPDPVTKSIDLTPYISPLLRLRFRYHQASYEWWWAIDNVELTCGEPVCNLCAAIAGSPGEPGTTVPLTLAILDSGDLLFEWGSTEPACDTTDYAVYKGDLSTLHTTGYSHDTTLTCTTAGASTFAIQTTDPRLGDADYYLVVGDNGVQEGSYGRDFDDLERPASIFACHPGQDVAVCLP
jgi:leucyl aminopeptidase